MTIVAGVALVSASACSPSEGAGDGSSETTGASPSGEALASVKPCELLSSETLKSFGLEIPGEAMNSLPWRPGCGYQGEPVSVTLYKDKRNTVASNEQKSTWAEFEHLEVNGRSGARAITQGTTKARLCNVMFDAGQGLIQVQAREDRLPDDVDECAKALEIAKKIEPNVPEPA
ncbi:DUF3558 family protein [Actinopolyspora alba]|uniref:DUF3558 family protein n=1 Tax=Actinopolyspora alba TaxID=673379 RepID=UPI000B880392|nr:DUF3558 family protein [Actinopolyspora alba]